jgi:hypothetical protein
VNQQVRQLLMTPMQQICFDSEDNDGTIEGDDEIGSDDDDDDDDDDDVIPFTKQRVMIVDFF